MPWKKPSEAIVATFTAALPDDPATVRRQMFGYPCAFTRGNMFSGLHQERLIVRLPEDARREVAALGGAPFEPMPGRPMKEYMVLPAAVLSDPEALRGWVARAFAFARSLAPKAAKKAAAKKAPAKKAATKKAAVRSGR